MRVVSCWCCFGCVQLSVVHRDPQQKQPSAGHAVGVDRLVHPAPSMDQNSVKMSSGDKVKHSSQSSGNLMVLPIRFSLPLVFISASCCDKQSFSVSVVQCNAHSFKVVSNHWFGNRKGIWPVKNFAPTPKLLVSRNFGLIQCWAVPTIPCGKNTAVLYCITAETAADCD